MSAGVGIDDVRIECEIRNVIRDVGLQFQSANHLIANLQLRHFNHSLQSEGLVWFRVRWH